MADVDGDGDGGECAKLLDSKIEAGLRRETGGERAAFDFWGVSTARTISPRVDALVWAVPRLAVLDGAVG